MLVVSCPSCAKLLQVADTATAQESVCPACGSVFQPNIMRHETSLTPQRQAILLRRWEPDGIADSLAEDTLQKLRSQPETTYFLDEWRATVRREQRQRRRVLMIGIPVTVFLVGLFVSFVLRWTTNIMDAVAAALFSTLFLFGPLLLVAYTLPALGDLKNGFLKAAGRPTRRPPKHKLEYDLNDEDLP
jgi:phage FluMu protein Com